LSISTLSKGDEAKASHTDRTVDFAITAYLKRILSREHADIPRVIQKNKMSLFGSMGTRFKVGIIITGPGSSKALGTFLLDPNIKYQ
jgi:hypothetical protein